MSWPAKVTRWLRRPSVRGIRGATTVLVDDPGQIRDAVLELLAALHQANQWQHAEIISAIFTMTPDLRSAFPAEAARLAGWRDIPLLCTAEVAVPGSLPRCLRVLLHVERCWDSPPIHLYLREAIILRPDLAPSDSHGGIAFHRQWTQHPPAPELPVHDLSR